MRVYINSQGHLDIDPTSFPDGLGLVLLSSAETSCELKRRREKVESFDLDTTIDPIKEVGIAQGLFVPSLKPSGYLFSAEMLSESILDADRSKTLWHAEWNFSLISARGDGQSPVTGSIQIVVVRANCESSFQWMVRTNWMYSPMGWHATMSLPIPALISHESFPPIWERLTREV